MKKSQPAWKKNKYEFNFGPIEVEVYHDDVEGAIKKLKAKLSKDGILAELKKRRCYEKPSDVKRRKRREAIRKMRKNNRNRKFNDR